MKIENHRDNWLSQGYLENGHYKKTVCVRATFENVGSYFLALLFITGIQWLRDFTRPDNINTEINENLHTQLIENGNIW